MIRKCIFLLVEPCIERQKRHETIVNNIKFAIKIII